LASGSSADSYQFGPFTVDRAGYRVLRDGTMVALTPKLLDLLLHLLDHAGELVTKEALLDAIWPDANVTDNALTQAVSELRQALGDDPARPRYIKTVARRGYRFIEKVTATTRASSSPAAAGATPDEDVESKTIAVFDFTNVTGDQDTAWLSAGVAETVTADLRSFGEHRVIDCRRVRDAISRLGNSLDAVAHDVHAGLVVVGSFQRSGPKIRITARLVNVATGEALADAKVDGPVDTIFDLQDRIVVQLAAEMGLKLQQTDGSRIGARETESLDAFRAFTEGWLHLESLAVDELQQAVVDFEHAVTLDHRYALAHTGLASARFALYESTRSENEPAGDLLRTALEHARHAVALDDGLAEAHASLALILVSHWETAEAVAEARRAVALEPTNWRHYFRLGHASWGDARLRAAETTLAHYPGFAFAHFQMAMLHVARGHLREADAILAEGAAVQDRQRGRRERYPALGLHWLRALIALSAGDVPGALDQFDDELALADLGRLYGREYAMNARYGRGVALLTAGRFDEAKRELDQALSLYPDHAQTHLALALMHRRTSSRTEAEKCFAQVDAALTVLTNTRPLEAATVRAARAAVLGRSQESSRILVDMLKKAAPGFAGWAVPVDPLLRNLLQDESFRAVEELLAARAD
jgi:DNA-binding winged helix-turn-helix (wHTH) protein/Tfp pilus assembly protein PilF